MSNIASDGHTTVTRGPVTVLSTGTAQTMTATSPDGVERHLLLALDDEPITPEQARALADVLTRFAGEGP